MWLMECNVATTGARHEGHIAMVYAHGRPMHAPHPTPDTPPPTRPSGPFGRTYHTSSSPGGGFSGMARISEVFFWISRIVFACSSRRRNRAFSFRSCSNSTAS